MFFNLIVQLLISSFIACEANVLISLIILQISFKSCYFAWDSINSGASFCILWKVFSLLFTKVALSYILIRSVLYIFVSWNFLLLFTLFFWYIFVYIFQMPSHPVVLGSIDRTHFKKSLIGCFWAHFLSQNHQNFLDPEKLFLLLELASVGPFQPESTFTSLRIQVQTTKNINTIV